MRIRDVIQCIQEHHYHTWRGQRIQPATTRDRVLYGNVDQVCTGVVTCIYASVDVIRQAASIGANLIIAHEALFWNHGDHTEWLRGHAVFQKKARLLERHGIVVWRDHDHLHAGVYWQGQWVDGIFYGLTQELGWQAYLVEGPSAPLLFEIPPTPVEALAQYLMKRMDLQGIRCLGSRQGVVRRILVPMHIMGKNDNTVIQKIEDADIDLLMTMELTDYTVSIYVRDAAMLGIAKTIFAIGHFNMEQPGMKWFGETYLPTILPNELPVHFLCTGDPYVTLRREPA